MDIGYNEQQVKCSISTRKKITISHNTLIKQKFNARNKNIL